MLEKIKFSDMHIEEKRAIAKALLAKNKEKVNSESGQAFNPTRMKLLKQFRLDTSIVRGVGHYLFDANETQYLDFLSQYGAVSLGHNHPELWHILHESGNEQIASMVQPLVPIVACELADKLAEITPGDLKCCIFTNSGAEAVEAAIKLARVRTGRLTILSTTNSFHGKTLGALSATGKPDYQVPFGAPVPYFEYVPFGDIEALEARLARDGNEIAAFIVEPIQGEGGVIPAPPGYLKLALALCRRYGALSIVDEIQTGLGRTGSLFALPEDAGSPDILVLAKALGGGLFPIGACISTNDAWDEKFGMLHSSTFANNNLACRIALGVIDLLQRDNQKLIRHVDSTGKYFMERLHQLQDKYPNVIKQVRGTGFMAGVEFHAFNGGDSYTMSFCSMNGYLVALFSAYLFNVHHVVTAPMFNSSHVLRLQPPFSVGRMEIDKMLSALETLCDALQRKDYHHITRHLISSPELPTGRRSYASCYEATKNSTVPESDKPKNAFAFLVHYTTELDVIKCDQSFEQFTDKEFKDWLEWSKLMGPGLIYHLDDIRSKTGNSVQGWLIAIPALPRDMISMGRSKALPLLEDAMKLAQEKGAEVVGLGGFTSIVSMGGKDLIGQGIPVTSGNCLTTVMAVAGIENVMNHLTYDLEHANASIVGATGAIGRLASMLLAARVSSLTMVGNASSPNALSRCRVIAGEIYQSIIANTSGDSLPINGMRRAVFEIIHPLLTIPLQELPIEKVALAETLRLLLSAGDAASLEKFTITVEQAFRQTKMIPPIRCISLDHELLEADVVVVATNSESALICSDHLKPGAVVCDISRPLNVSPKVIEERNDVLVFEGGLVELPQAVHFGPLQGLPTGITLGCLAETILLAIEGEYSDHSIGLQLELDEANYLTKLAQKHGFLCSSPYCNGKMLEEKDFRRIKLLRDATSRTDDSNEMPVIVD